MKLSIREVSGSITAPKGFIAGGVFCDIKRLGTGKGSDKGNKRDLALIVSEVSATAAGLFTTNQVCAAPVKVCVEHLRRGTARAIVVNSGNANACTGRQGLADARAMAASVSTEISRILPMDPNPIPTTDILVASTGRIGVVLPIDRVRKGIVAASAVLGATAAHADHAAEAILTSDTRPKQFAVEFRMGGKTVRIGGICKGAGMIQPGMSTTGRRPAATPRGLNATMLAFLTTDARVESRTLRLALEEAVAKSFNRITVDGDMSTNDTVLILANGLANNTELRLTRNAQKIGDFAQFQAALDRVCLALAQMIVRDGEGTTRFVTVSVEGARTDADADAAARAVANSSLVKTSWNGGDPNWGRIIDALGYSSARIDEQNVDIGYTRSGSRRVVWSLRKGQPTKTPFVELWRLVQEPEFEVRIRLNLGNGEASIYAADLSEKYVAFNKGAITDPAQAGNLGG